MMLQDYCLLAIASSKAVDDLLKVAVAVAAMVTALMMTTVAAVVTAVAVVALVVDGRVVVDLGHRHGPGLGHGVGHGYLYGHRDLLLVDDWLSLFEQRHGNGERERHREQILLPVEKQQRAHLLGQHDLLPVGQLERVALWQQRGQEGDGQRDR